MQTARTVLEGWVTAAGLPVNSIRYASTPQELNATNLNAVKVLYVPSDVTRTDGGLTPTLNNALIAMRQRISAFLNIRGTSSICWIGNDDDAQSSIPFLILPIDLAI